MNAHTSPAEFTNGIDSQAVLLARAAALDALFQAGEISPDAAIQELIVLIGPFLPQRCPTCGDPPCLHDESWCTAVREGKVRRAAEQEVTIAKRAASSTVEALMYGLRSGVKELDEPDTLRRLCELSDEQLREVVVRLQSFQPHIAPAWKADDIEVLILVRREARAKENS
jgi:hypothetical protein